MSLEPRQFDEFHLAVHGRRPFAWQSRLLEEVTQRHAWPRVLDLPTGSGKTTCIDVALFALALDAENTPMWCPRRIALVVDRRLVVDQAADRGRRLLRALLDPGAGPVVNEVARRLKSLCGGEEPLGVFVLRGGVPKDDGWARTPDQPLILASTVDQLGSRLLVQGYGVSRGMRPVHAGLLGNDTLVLLDEVHLSEPFRQTLEQLSRLRARNEAGLPRRFHFSLLSATPGDEREAFRLTRDEMNEGGLRPRLEARKPASLVNVEGRGALEDACVKATVSLIEDHALVAVIVNRVASATRIHRALRDAWRDGDTVLLTGRMRPLDRDDVLRDLRPRVMADRSRDSDSRKLIVVGTQCLEAGADFDFDALVTESASLDALRQRFGRLARLGLYQRARGVIIHDKAADDGVEDESGDARRKNDPVYGEAVSKTEAWIRRNLTGTERTIDFGTIRLPLPTPAELVPLCAPKHSAPLLLPAYLDLWVQTSPPPQAVPEVSLWLHGPRDAAAEVQVIWRADLTEEHLVGAREHADENDSALLARIVGAVRPSSLEAVALPFGVAQRWLRSSDDHSRRRVLGRTGDVEGLVAAEERTEQTSPGCLALRWLGEDSEVIDANSLRPGDTIVVPATRGGIDSTSRSFDPESTSLVTDLAERAAFFGRGLPMLRLQPEVLAGLGLVGLPMEDRDEVRTALADIAAAESGWRAAWLSEVARAATEMVIDADEPWVVLRGRRLPAGGLRRLLTDDNDAEIGVDLTSDEEDSPHAGRPVPLSLHSADVENLARDFAQRLRLSPALVSDIALAGWLHDIGKADRRFQVMLRGGSEIEFFKDETIWAKSGLPPEAKAAQRRAQTRSGYPRRCRHEVQALALLECRREDLATLAADPELVLYLIGSHHGYCRPFAPAVPDDTPVDVAIASHASRTFGTWHFEPVSSDHGLHRLDAPLADRFWTLAERYGWLELCWFEAILRLADHRASEARVSGR